MIFCDMKGVSPIVLFEKADLIGTDKLTKAITIAKLIGGFTTAAFFHKILFSNKIQKNHHFYLLP